MNTEILGVILQWVALVVLCYPLGRYIAKVYRGERTWLDFMAPVERFVYRVCGIDPAQEMDWKQFLKALLMVNLFWFFWGMLLLVFQGRLPLNPDGNPGQSPDLAFNTCISFMVNCNLQHYSGETGLSYFTQLFVIMLFQFVTAACGMAAMAGVMKALAAKTTKTIGNFWVFLTKSVTRILMPLSLVVGILLVINGTPMSFDGKQTITTLEGQEQVISQGPTAAIVPIKQLGTNGGGYFGTNSAHPLENPNAFTNILECWSILILPMAMAFAFGFYTRRRRLAAWIFAVMLFAYIAGVVFSVWQETGGSRQIDRMGIAQELGSMEGKEIRIGSAASAMWGMTTTVTSNGSVDSMHDSQTPLSGMLQMLNMQINCWFGGVGVGWMNYFAFLIIAVFISGLMVGRTPEFLGKKVEAREMKIATLVVLMHPLPDPRRHGNFSRRSRCRPGDRLAQQPLVPRPERNALRVHLLGRQQRFGFRGAGRQYAVLEYFDRHCADHGALFPDRGAGRHRRAARFEEIYPRKCRYAQDRYGNLLADDFRRHHHRRCALVLPCAGTGPDRRLPDFLKCYDYETKQK